MGAGHTQHRSAEGWVYLAVVVDAWSRRVVGWSIADHLRTELVVDALEMARLRRFPDGTVAYSDHGCQYTSWVFGQRLRHAGLLGSMGTVGDALDNASPRPSSPRCSASCSTARAVDTSRPGSSHLRMDRSLLQPDPPPLHPRLPQLRLKHGDRCRESRRRRPDTIGDSALATHLELTDQDLVDLGELDAR